MHSSCARCVQLSGLVPYGKTWPLSASGRCYFVGRHHALLFIEVSEIMSFNARDTVGS